MRRAIILLPEGKFPISCFGELTYTAKVNSRSVGLPTSIGFYGLTFQLVKANTMPDIVTRSYVEYRNDAYWIEGTRISLDSVVYAFQKGESPESIVQSFPLLTLEQVYGAITFYLANRAQIDAYLTIEEAAFDAMPQPLQTTAPALYDKLSVAKYYSCIYVEGRFDRFR